MTLAEYVQSFPSCERVAVRMRIACGLGVSETFVRSMCNGNKKIPSKHAIQIENLTSALVPRHITAPLYYPQNEGETAYA